MMQLADVKCPFKAVAEYPPALPYVGQDTCYHRLQDFTDGIQRESEAHFLAIFGDWAIGKSRLAHELIAQFCGQSRGWVLTEGEPATPLLRTLSSGGMVLPLFVSFVDALSFEQFGLDSGTAMGKLTCAAVAYLADQRRARSSHRDLLAALRNALTELDPNFDFERLAALATDTSRSYVERAANIVRALGTMTRGGVARVLVIVDEVESGGEVNPFADEIEREVNSRPIPLRAVRDLYAGVKDATNTNAYQGLNFMFFNTLVSKRMANMEALERRMLTADLEKASAADLDRLVAALRQSGYPLQGTLEDLARRAFFAADRNFGWFSFIMNKAHYILVQQPELGIGQVFAEVCERTGRVFQPRVFEDRDIQPPALKNAMRAIIYNQIPATLPQLGISPALRADLLSYQDPFQTRFVGEASVVEVSADQLTDDLLATDQYVSERKPKLTGEGSVNFDPAEVLASLRTFMWGHNSGSSGMAARLWIYNDPADFEGQVSFAYGGFGANLSTATVRAIHRVLLGRHRVQPDMQLVAPTMALLRRFNDLWGKAAASNWLPEVAWEQLISTIDRTPDQNDQRLLRGVANTLFEMPQPVTPAPYPDIHAPSLTLKLEAHESLNVTPRNQLVLLKAQETPQGTVEDLKAIRQRIPVLILFSRPRDRDSWAGYLRETHQEHLAIAVIPHVAEPQTREWEFYIRYALRDQPGGFKPGDVMPKGKELRNEFRDVLHDKFNQWLRGAEDGGYVLRPFFPARSASASAFRTFVEAYAALVRAGDAAALGPQGATILKGLDDYERERQADTLALTAGDVGQRRATEPAIMPRILDLLRANPRKLADLESELFYARSMRIVSWPATGIGVLEQLMALLLELGVVETDAQGRYLVRTISTIDAKFDLAFQRIGAFEENAKSGYAQQVSSLSEPVQALASQLAVNEHQLSLLKRQRLGPQRIQLSQLPLDELTVLPPNQQAFEQVARSIRQVASALDVIFGQPGQNSTPPALDPRTLQENINRIAGDREYREFSIEYRVNFLKQLEEYLSGAERELRRVVAERRDDVKRLGATGNGEASFPTAPILGLLAGIESDLDNTLPGMKLPPPLQQGHNDVPLKVLNGAGRLADVLLKLTWYREQLDVGNPGGWWVQYTNAHTMWRSAVSAYQQAAHAWGQLERYFAGTAPEHVTIFTGPELNRDMRELADAVAGFEATNDADDVTLQDIEREIEAVGERRASALERIEAARANAEAEIQAQLDESDDGAVRHLAARLQRESILPSRQRVTDARTHREAHAALDTYRQDIEKVGAALCGERRELFARYVQMYRDSAKGLSNEQLIERYGEPLLREMSERKLVSLRLVVDL